MIRKAAAVRKGGFVNSFACDVREKTTKESGRADNRQSKCEWGPERAVVNRDSRSTVSSEVKGRGGNRIGSRVEKVSRYRLITWRRGRGGRKGRLRPSTSPKYLKF